MTIPPTAPDLLDREFLEMRSLLLRLAASLDRMDRASGDLATDPRLQKIRSALAMLSAPEADRVERIQLLFSRPFETDWRSRFGLTK
jgi:hypothetical protein